MVQRIRKVQNEREGGFTLIELLIVIVVLGILAGIVVFGLGTFKQEAKLGACKADVKQVQTAVDAYMALPSNTTNAVPIMADLTGGTPPLLKTSPPTDETILIDASTGNVTGTYADSATTTAPCA
jgi:prepilin-type N-terminal cleavage/methylation domain-containing protein